MITIYDWFGYDLSIRERYRLIKEAGFDGVLLWWSEFLDRNDYRSGPPLVREAGLFIENIHTPFQVQDDLWLDNLKGEASITCYLQCASDCAEFEIPTMVIHLPDEAKPHTALGLDRLKKLTETAERLGVNLAFENLWNLTNLSFVMEQLDSPRVGFCYDCAHHDRYYPDLDLLTMYGSRMMALHLHDNSGKAMHRLPMDGTIDWPETMKKIAETGYAGSTAIEAMNWDYKDLTARAFLEKAFYRATQLATLRSI